MKLLSEVNHSNEFADLRSVDNLFQNNEQVPQINQCGLLVKKAVLNFPHQHLPVYTICMRYQKQTHWWKVYSTKFSIVNVKMRPLQSIAAYQLIIHYSNTNWKPKEEGV